MKVQLKLKRRHPAEKMRLGRYIIGIRYKTFDLNEKELKELKQDGPKYWFQINQEKKPKK